MESTASDYFGRLVSEYDSLIRRAVPRYDELLERLLAYLPPLPRGRRRVLELGCGTGNYALLLAHHARERWPDLELTVVDGSAEMVATTRTRVGATGFARLIPVQARFEALPFAPGSFDLVTSCISVHHVADKPALFRRLFTLLAPGGELLLGDQMRGGTERAHALNWQRWLAWCRTHCTVTEAVSLIDHAYAHDHYVSVPDHLSALAAAGFVDVDCAWRNWMWGIVTARRPPAAESGP